MNNIWGQLLDFETRDLITHYFDEKFKLRPSASKVNEISSNFIQGREYFASAKNANFAVKPLLLFYGVMALSRGLILATSPRLSESSIKPSHGLSIIDWTKTLMDRKIADLEVVVTKGTFFSLLEATKNKSYYRVRTSAINWQISYDIPQLNQKVKLIDILRYIPDLSREYKKAVNEEPIYAEFMSYEMDHAESKYKIGISGSAKDEVINEVFSLLVEKSITKINGNTIISFPMSSNYFPCFSQKWDGWLDIGDVHVIASNNNNFQVNNLGLFYISSYILGMLARYFPSTWISLGRVEKGDKFFPLIIKLIDLIERTYPKIILDHLNSPYDFEKQNKAQED